MDLPTPSTLATYGLTEEAYRAMHEAQDGRCGICRRSEVLVIDHDHDTGQVRGLLCTACNTTLGKLGDRPLFITAAAVYLTQALHRGAIMRRETVEAPKIVAAPRPPRTDAAPAPRRVSRIVAPERFITLSDGRRIGP